MTKGNENKLDVFYTKCLRRILKIQWQEHIRNEFVLERAEMKNISDEARRRRCKYIRHILWKDINNDCLIAITWAPEGKKKTCRPNIPWRRTVEKERRPGGWRT